MVARPGVEGVSVDVSTRAPSGATTAYVLGDSDALLVDPAGRTDALDGAVEERNVSHLALTHHHRDHTGGVAAYADAYDLTVWARAGREGAFEAATGVEPDRTFREGTVLPAGGGVEVIETPGHAPEHVAFSAESGLVTGDLAVAEGSVVVGAPEGDMRAYVTSLRRVHARNPNVLYPGHGPVVEDPRATCRRLVDHRRQRERRVLAAVDGGAETLAEVVDAAYEKDVSDVRDLAMATARAHLEKLAVEGRVRWDGERARPA
ncbi:MBL fold metallo-hydrolase [Salinirussus salinus]|jgi:glyoxylase-like metal-dependent hydrolase (beta-lactamase superfamily II)|uniref:MBL fold metallo-hydrolase n=1 Tax=Salinirussus salinus TaxID=1198300 RepID=UPI001357189A|nr:MBL fold metallo-hydrolase [Salinirussus salinus]